MKASNIAEQEAKFSTELTNTSRVKYTEIGKVEIANGDTTIRQIRPNFDSYYYKSETKKDMIVIHSTAGTLRADMASLTGKDNHVSVSYVIARSGEVYELFDPKYWSYHLGTGSVGGNKPNSQRSIAIEMSNYGPLTLRGEGLETIYSQIQYKDSNGDTKKTKKDVYCTLDEPEYYSIVEDGYRGYQYFAAFTDEQYKALNNLLDHLCVEHDIPKTFIDEDKRFETFSTATEAKEYKGICTHVNFRKSGKWDLGPDFAWEKLTGDDVEVGSEEISLESLMTPVSKPTEDVVDEPVVSTPEPVVEEKPVKKFSWLSFILKLFRK